MLHLLQSQFATFVRTDSVHCFHSCTVALLTNKSVVESGPRYTDAHDLAALDWENDCGAVGHREHHYK
eukprot:SAG31_NODE_10583_length_1121_cov_1.354207_1_plen_67_part_10